MQRYFPDVVFIPSMTVGATDAHRYEEICDTCLLYTSAIGASDAHVPEQVGKYVTWLPETVTTLPDFVTALHTLCLLYTSCSRPRAARTFAKRSTPRPHTSPPLTAARQRSNGTTSPRRSRTTPVLSLIHISTVTVHKGEAIFPRVDAQKALEELEACLLYTSRCV